MTGAGPFQCISPLASLCYHMYCICNTKEVASWGRLPVAMRLPRHEVEVVDAFARSHGMTKTDAFLHFLRRGIEGEGMVVERLDAIEAALREVVRRLPGDEACDAEAVAEAVAREAAMFPAIERVVLFGSFARGEATLASDIDLRIEVDRGEPFSLYDLARFQKAVGRRTGREVDAVTADAIANENLAAAIAREGRVVYER